MSFDFGALAQAAVKNNYASKTPLYELPVEKARAFVKIKDGNRKPAENGSQALVLTLGRFNLGLDIIAPNATRVFATAEQIEQYTAVLQEAIDSGAFDEEIKLAQLKSDPNRQVPPELTNEQISKAIDVLAGAETPEVIEDDLNDIYDDDDLTLVDQQY